MELKNLSKAKELYDEKMMLLQMRDFINKKDPRLLEFTVIEINGCTCQSKEVVSEKFISHIEKAIYDRLTEIDKEAEAL